MFRSVLTPSRREGGSIRLVVSVLLAIAVAVGGWFMMSSGSKAPEVTYMSLRGDQISTDDLKGKVVLVNFWATSCVTCVKKMPMLIEAYKEYNPQGFEVVAVAMHYDPPNYVAHFTETRQLPFTVALDPTGSVAKEFGDVRLTPTAFLIDREGRIVKRYLGEVDEARFKADIEAALMSS